MTCLTKEILETLDKPTTILELEMALRKKMDFDDLSFEKNITFLIKNGSIRIVLKHIKYSYVTHYHRNNHGGWNEIKPGGIFCNYIEKV